MGGNRYGGEAQGPRDTLRYGADERAPVEAVLDEDDSLSSSDDDEPPEAAGQIKSRHVPGHCFRRDQEGRILAAV